MAKKVVDDVVAQAIAATEQELFAGAFDKEDHVEDDSGDTSREQMKDEFEEGEEVEAADAKSESDEDKGGESDDAKDAEADDDQVRDAKTGKFAKADAAKDGKSEDDDADGEKSQAAKSEAGKPDADKAAGDGKVPSGVHRQVSERARIAEAERDAARAEAAAVREEVKATNARLDQFLALQRQQPAKVDDKSANPVTPPDIFEDPKGFVSHLEKGFQTELSRRDQQLENIRVGSSMQIAHGFHKEAFEKAYAAVTKLDRNNPDDQVTVRRIWASPNPGESLVTWHRNQETLREVGGDPASFKERIRTETREALMKDPEFRKQLLAGLREEAAGAGVDGKPRTAFKVPKSLNGASGGKRDADDTAPIDDSDRALFDGAFQT